MRAMFAVLVLLGGACSPYIGPRAAEHPLSLGAEGATIKIQLVSRDGGAGDVYVTGELLSVTYSGLWVLADSHASWVAFSAIARAELQHTGDDDIEGPGAPDSAALERLRLESRFPQGLSPELMRKLLLSYGDTAPRTIGFLDSARAATDKYRDVRQALADGYRPMGPGTPAMGQHWVNVGLLLSGTVDPAAPPILEYAGTPDAPPVLVGVAYAVPLAPGEMPPDTPVPASWWHTHQGTLDAEGLNGSHAGMDMGTGDRVAVLHAWLWLPNPAGIFEAENWLLPLATWVRGFGDN